MWLLVWVVKHERVNVDQPCEIFPESALSNARNASKMSSRAWNDPGHLASTSKNCGNSSSSAPCDSSCIQETTQRTKNAMCRMKTKEQNQKEKKKKKKENHTHTHNKSSASGVREVGQRFSGQVTTPKQCIVRCLCVACTWAHATDLNFLLRRFGI